MPNVLAKAKGAKLKDVKIGDKDISMQQAKLRTELKGKQIESSKLQGNFKKVK